MEFYGIIECAYYKGYDLRMFDDGTVDITEAWGTGDLVDGGFDSFACAEEYLDKLVGDPTDV